MKSGIVIHRIETHSEQWHAFRKNGIGASEIACVLAKDDHRFRGSVFDEKIGRTEPNTEPNKHMHWGLVLEDLVAENWQYHDGEQDSYLHHYQEGNIQRRCKRINGIVTNPDYPWLFCNLDRAINKGYFRLDDKTKVLDKECPLECKTVHPMLLARYEAGLPVSHILQVHQQMILTETDYSEIVIFDCLRNLHFFHIPFNKSLAEGMLEHSKHFWYNMVLPARELILKQKETSSQEEWEKLEAEISKYEPPIDDTNACEEYLKERYRGNQEKIQGGMPEYELSKEYLYLKEIGKEIEAMVRSRKNQLMSYMGNAEELSFEEAGRVDWKKNDAGTRVFRPRLKGWKADEDKVKKEVGKIEIFT